MQMTRGIKYRQGRVFEGPEEHVAQTTDLPSAPGVWVPWACFPVNSLEEQIDVHTARGRGTGRITSTVSAFIGLEQGVELQATPRGHIFEVAKFRFNGIMNKAQVM